MAKTKRQRAREALYLLGDDKERLLLLKEAISDIEVSLDAIEGEHTLQSQGVKVKLEEISLNLSNLAASLEDRISEIGAIIENVKSGLKANDLRQEKSATLNQKLDLRVREALEYFKKVDGKEIVRALSSLKGDDRLSVLLLKDLEWLKSKEGMQWSSAGFKVYTDATLTGDGSYANPLSSKGTSGSYQQNFLVSDWIISGDEYILDVVHSLGSANPIVEVRQSGAIIQVNSIENVDVNTIRLTVTTDPNLRFDGTVSIIKV